MTTAQQTPYQGLPYDNPAFTDAPSVPPVDPDQPITSQPTSDPAPTRPVTLELNTTRTEPRIVIPMPISQAEREVQERYGQSSATRSEPITSPYVNETIFYDPFENRRIAHPMESPSPESKAKELQFQTQNDPSDEDSDDAETVPKTHKDPTLYAIPPQQIQQISPESSAILAGPSTSSASSSEPSPGSSNPGSSSAVVYYAKEPVLYSSAADFLPATIPMDQFPEPPPAYTEIDLASPMSPTTQQPPRFNMAAGPNSPGGPGPIIVPDPNRKYIVCQYCNQNVLTVIKKESGPLTHAFSILCCCIGCIPLVVCAYCTDILKEDRHYCPNCDLLVGHERPGLGGPVYRVDGAA